MTVFPLSLSSNGRYLVDATGTPFPIFGDSAWEAAFNLVKADRTTYIANRVSLGFTSTLFEIVEHDFTLKKPPQNISSAQPYLRRLDGSAFTGSPNGTTGANGSAQQYGADNYTSISTQAADWTYPNEAFWSVLDDYIASLYAAGVAAFVFIAYVGFAGAQEGWMSEMVQLDSVIGAGGFAGRSFANPSKSLLWNFGAYFADRYKSYLNVIPIFGGDYGNAGSNSGAFTAPQKAAVESLREGMKSVSSQIRVLDTAHWGRPALASDVSFPSGPFTIQGVYTNTFPAHYMRTGYAASVGPTFQIEGEYEGTGSAGVAPFRQYNWWCVTSGGGYFFGNEDLWPFNDGSVGTLWSTLLATTATLDMQRLHQFMGAIAWWTLVPGGVAGQKTIVVANGSNDLASDYISASASMDGTLAVLYVPPSWASGTFSIDMSVMCSLTTLVFYDPTNGQYKTPFYSKNVGTLVVTPPGTNFAGQTDWVLLMTSQAIPRLGGASSSPLFMGGGL